MYYNFQTAIHGMKDFGQEFLPVSKIQMKLNSVMKIFVFYQHLAAKNHLNAYHVVRPFEAIKRNFELILSVDLGIICTHCL